MQESRSPAYIHSYVKWPFVFENLPGTEVMDRLCAAVTWMTSESCTYMSDNRPVWHHSSPQIPVVRSLRSLSLLSLSLLRLWL